MGKKAIQARELNLQAKNYKTTYLWLKKGLLLFKRCHFFSPPHIETDVFGKFWMLWILDVKKDNLGVGKKNIEKIPPGEYLLLIPPFSIVEWHIFAPYLEWTGYVWPNLNSDLIPYDKATLLKYEKNLIEPKCINELVDIIHEATSIGTIDKEKDKNPLAILIKQFLDEKSEEELKLNDIAKKFRLKDYELTRIFKNEYDISPSVYWQKLKVMNSIHMMLFLNPNKVSTVAFENGFVDLSRFNKNFFKHTKSTPSQHMRVSNIQN